MADQIRISPEAMRGRARDVYKQRDAFDDVIRAMKQLINALQTEWEGDSSREFASQFQSLQPAFNDMEKLLDDLGGQLDATAKAMEEMDKHIAKQFSRR
jgi:WXG100 family type VII secretion target